MPAHKIARATLQVNKPQRQPQDGRTNDMQRKLLVTLQCLLIHNTKQLKLNCILGRSVLRTGVPKIMPSAPI